MFVSFGDAASAATPRQRAIVWPERGVFGVVDGDVDAIALLIGALDSGLRTSTSVDDVAELIDGVHLELRAREEPATAELALLVVEVDALAFFAMGEVTTLLAGPGFSRRVIPLDHRVALGGDGAPKFFRAYVRAGDVVVIRAGGGSDRAAADVAREDEPAVAARRIVSAARGSGAVTAVVVRVDEEPKIR